MYTAIPSIPDTGITEYQRVINYSSIFAQNTNTDLVLIAGLPVNYVVCGCSAVVNTSFTGSNLNSLQMSVGAFVPNTVLSSQAYYLANIELTQAATSQSFLISGVPNNDLSKSSSLYTTFYPSPVSSFYNGAHDISAYFTANGTNFILTAGTVTVTVQIRSL
jgi:hypothetical protein